MGRSRPFSCALSCLGLDLARQASRVLSTPCARLFLKAMWLSPKGTDRPPATEMMLERGKWESPGPGSLSLGSC